MRRLVQTVDEPLDDGLREQLEIPDPRENARIEKRSGRRLGSGCHIPLFGTGTAFTSFSIKPLRLFTLLGFAFMGLSALGVVFYVFLFLVGNPPPGITTLIVLGLLGIGINSLGIGVLGEYLGRTYAETKRRPLYVIADSVNMEDRGLPTVAGSSADPASIA